MTMNIIDQIGNTEYEQAFNEVMVSYVLDLLNEVDREILEMYYLDDCSMDEIGEKLGRPANTCSQIKSRALMKLRILLKEV